jgi:aminoglycoside 9-adenylyltransferase
MAQFSWDNAPNALRDNVLYCVDSIVGIIPNLTGVYLYGALATGCYHPRHNHIDLIVVVREDVTTKTLWDFIRLLVRVSAKPYTYSVSLIKESTLFPWRHPLPLIFHYDEHLRVHYEQMLLDLTFEPISFEKAKMILTLKIGMIQRWGICLIGQELEYTFPPIPRNDFLKAMMWDVEMAYENMVYDPVYAVLALSRAYFFLLTGQIVCRDVAAELILPELNQDIRVVVYAIIMYYRGDKVGIPFDPIDVAKAVAYIEAKVTTLYTHQELL